MATGTKSKRSTSQSGRGVAPCDDKLTKQLGVRLSVVEYNRILSVAKLQGRTSSNYLRRVLLGIEKGI